MRRRAAAITTLLAAWTGCGLESGVGQDGTFGVLPDAPIADTAVYPLETLVISEHEAQGVLVYVFRGELDEAGLGLRDLRRIGIDHGDFRIRFERLRSTFAPTGLDAAPSAPFGGRDRTRLASPSRTRVGSPPEGDGPRLLAGGTPVRLEPLNDAGLSETGASRFLRSVTDEDYSVQAYSALVPPHASSALELRVDGQRFDISPSLEPLRLGFVDVADEERFELTGTGTGADYLIVDMLQTITNVDDGAELDAIVRTSMSPDTTYGPSYGLLSDSFGQGCWSREQDLRVRVTQVARDYHASANGDLAHIERRFDRLRVAPARWAPSLRDVSLAAYCNQWEAHQPRGFSRQEQGALPVRLPADDMTR